MLTAELKARLVAYVNQRYHREGPGSLDAVSAIKQGHLDSINNSSAIGLERLLEQIDYDQAYNQGKFKEKAAELKALWLDLRKAMNLPPIPGQK